MPKYKVVGKIKKKGYPTASAHYKTAHERADKLEKKKYPKGYAIMKRVDDRLKKNELAGSHTRSGKIEVSRKVPLRERREVAYHEFKEWQKDHGKCAICHKSKASHH